MGRFGSKKTKDFMLEVSEGNVPGHSVVHKFGHNEAVGTSFVPVTRGGDYYVPKSVFATPLRIAGGHVDDASNGSGAREITMQGLDETGALVEESLATNGINPSGNTSTLFMRLFRAWVSKSGTYANPTTGSHADSIVVEDSSGTQNWGTIEFNGFPRAQTEIGIYTVPVGKKAYLLSALILSDSTKTTELIFFRRTGILQSAAPYDAMRVIVEEKVEGGYLPINPVSPMFIGTECDVGFMAKVDATTAAVQVDFELLLVDI